VSAPATAPRRVVLADDEPLARERLRMLLAAHPGWRVAGEAEDGASAVRAILEARPDLVFLDIRMPELSGIEVVDALDAAAEEHQAPLPAIVFVTAHDEYAVRAFEQRALDYLLKPVDAPRMARALARVEERLAAAPAAGTPAAAPDVGVQLRELLAALGTTPAWPRRFVVRDAKGGLYFVRAADVEWVEAQENYVALHAGGRVHLVRDTMKRFEAKLDPDVFVRVHRSAIVSLDHVARLEPYAHGEYTIVLRDGTRLRTSKAHGARLLALLR
jgi:two-component system LytT family response regulator